MYERIQKPAGRPIFAARVYHLLSRSGANIKQRFQQSGDSGKSPFLNRSLRLA
jgi:hypothetical protein